MTPNPEPSAGSQRLGIVLVLCASFLFAFSDATTKVMVGTLSPVVASWIRCVMVVAFTIPFMVWKFGPTVFVTRHPFQQIARATAVTFSSIVFIIGLTYLPLADASAINFIWPVVITVFSVLLLGEKVGIRRGLATLAGFIGMLIIVRPGSSAFQAAAMYPLGAAVLWAIASVMTRGMAGTERPETTVVWSAVVMLVLVTLMLPFAWTPPGWHEWSLGIIVGVCASVGHGMVIYAYTRSSASTLAPFHYVQLVWATLAGYLIFGTIPDRWIILGASIIVASGIYTIHRERVRRLEAEKAARTSA